MTTSTTPSPGVGQTRSRGRDLVAQVAGPLRAFAASGASSAALLLIATVVAVVWANSPWSETYKAFWDTELAFRLGGAELSLDLKHWVNDGLMVFFFFVVGLEVKRELVMGELTDRRRAAVPFAAAVTGLAVPALVYLLFNPSGEAAAAWGVVISTDTAFLLGVLVLVGPACPTQLRLFLLTLAVADDVGALAIIALFYTEELALGPLALAAAGIGLMLVMRFGLRVWRGPAYFVIAVGVWIAMYASGVHPTIAGVVIALFTPAFPPQRAEVEDAARLARAFRQSPNPEFARAARLGIERSVSSNERLQALYAPWSAFVIVPVFALANAGVTLDGEALRAALTSPVTLGVVAGLVLGKLLGILVGVGASVGLRLGRLAPGLTGWQLAGGAALSGIGFTLSLFIVDLALDDPVLADQARVGVLVASVLAALLGWAVFRIGDALRGDSGSGAPVLLDPPVDPERDHVRGPVDAPLTLVEYGDFECPYCGRATGAVEELRERFGDRLRYVFRHVPLVDVHGHAELAAEAAEAAGAQGRFWKMHDRLFAHQDALDVRALLEHAAAIGLDVQRFSKDLGSGRFGARVRDDVASAQASGVGSTPTFFVGGRRHTGPYDAESLARALLEGLDALEETPDSHGEFPRLTDAQRAVLAKHGTRRTVTAGDVLFREGDPGYDFHAVLAGRVAVVEDLGRTSQRVVAVSGAGRFLGELNLLDEDQPVYLSAVVVADGEVLVLPADRLRAAFAESPELRDAVQRAFLLRRARLLAMAADLHVVGRAAEAAPLREWAAARGVSHTTTDLDTDAGALDLLQQLGAAADDTPLAVWRGAVLRRATVADLDRVGAGGTGAGADPAGGGRAGANAPGVAPGVDDAAGRTGAAVRADPAGPRAPTRTRPAPPRRGAAASVTACCDGCGASPARWSCTTANPAGTGGWCASTASSSARATSGSTSARTSATGCGPGARSGRGWSPSSRSRTSPACCGCSSAGTAGSGWRRGRSARARAGRSCTCRPRRRRSRRWPPAGSTRCRPTGASRGCAGTARWTSRSRPSTSSSGPTASRPSARSTWRARRARCSPA
jgi:Na+:H+ antiporter, NhaA family